MNNCTYKFLRLSNFKDIPNWSVQYAEEENLGFTKKYPMARIGSFLAKSQDTIVVQDDVAYKQVTIKINNGGVVPRNNGATLKGDKIGTKRQKIVHTGQFIMSKIDARNGAYGIVPEELDGAIVTNDFPVFDVDDSKILPQFLVLVSTTDRFIEFARKCSSGTTNRKRIDIDAFLQQKIPLPSLEEQEKVLEEYNAHIRSAVHKQNSVKSLAFHSRNFIRKELGIKIKEHIKDESFLQFTHYKDTKERWDVSADSYSIEGNYPIEKLGKFLSQISTGTTPPTSHPEYFNGNIKFYTPSDLGNDKYLTDSARTISDLAITEKKARLFRRGDILFVGIGSTIGKVGIVYDSFVSSNQQITGLTVDKQKINPEYVYYYLLYNRDITTSEQSKTTLPIVNQEKICKIPIVLPPLHIQNTIVQTLDEFYLTAKKNEREAPLLLKKAFWSFERYIFD